MRCPWGRPWGGGETFLPGGRVSRLVWGWGSCSWDQNARPRSEVCAQRPRRGQVSGRGQPVGTALPASHVPASPAPGPRRPRLWERNR